MFLILFEELYIYQHIFEILFYCVFNCLVIIIVFSRRIYVKILLFINFFYPFSRKKKKNETFSLTISFYVVFEEEGRKVVIIRGYISIYIYIQ